MIVTAHPRYEVLLLDLRGHGETPLLNPPSRSSAERRDNATLADAAADVAFTLNALGRGTPDVVCGHSMGGKVALAYLEAAAAGRWAADYMGLLGVPRAVWTLDSVPGPVPERASQPPPDEKESVASVLAAVAQVKTPVAAKADVASQLEALGCSRATAQWMTTNLRPVEGPSGGGAGAGAHGGFEFVFELGTCQALFADYAVRDCLPLVQRAADGEFDCVVDVVRAGRNASAWPPNRVAELERACVASGRTGSDGGRPAAAVVHLLRESGHNVHIDAPKELLALMEARLSA